MAIGDPRVGEADDQHRVEHRCTHRASENGTSRLYRPPRRAVASEIAYAYAYADADADADAGQLKRPLGLGAVPHWTTITNAR